MHIQEQRSECLVIVMQGNWNPSHLIFYQHVTCATRGDEALNHLYSTHRNTYKAFPRPPFGKYGQNSILPIPAYKQKLKQEVLVTRSIWKSSDEVEAKLKDCFNSTDWNMFRDSTNNIQDFITSHWLH